MSNLIDTISAAVRDRVLADLGVTASPASEPCKCGTPVVVTSQTRDIWFGYSVTTGPITTIERARVCYYYAAPSGPDKGVGSLATVGPQAGSKIGPRNRRVTIMNVCGVVECDEAAVKAWEDAKWGA